jgi:hypothetical protein
MAPISGHHPGCKYVLAYSRSGSATKYRYFKKKTTASAARDAMVRKAIREKKTIHTSIRKRGEW